MGGKILGISAFYHDSAAAIIEDGRITFAAQEERFTRIKQDSAFPSNACRFCLDQSGLSIDDLDAVVFYDKPFLKFERLLETYYGFAPRGAVSFIKAIPVWLKEKIFLKRILFSELQKIEPFSKKETVLLFPEHHLSHAASAFYPSPFREAAIITIDGVGEWATATIGYGNKESIEIKKELHFPHSLGLLYSAFTYWLGFKVNSGEYKLMGLAPYGIPGSKRVEEFTSIIREKLVQISDDGSIWLNQKYFKYATGLRMVPDKEWEDLFGFPRRNEEDKLEQKHCDLAFAIQHVTEEVFIKIAREAKRLTGSDYLCIAGGSALNCVANGKVLRENLFKDIFIQPAAGDAGGAIGGALAAYHLYFEQPREINPEMDGMQGAQLGPEYSNLDIEKCIRKNRAVSEYFEDFNALADKVAGLIDEGKIVGWFQGRMEFGPRALGNRSILGDARNKDMQKVLNLKIKYRESFRPFAPSVLEEDLSSFFDIDTPSPYMLMVADVKKERRDTIPENYNALPLMERLYVNRSDIPAVTHIDFSGRIQSVNKKTNPRYWNLINKFKEKTGFGILVNTSFNVRGEPIVCSPDEAYRCFMRTEMNYLVIGNYLFEKEKQPNWKEAKNWKEEFKLD